ncbi:hypothetical protein [Rickettsia endosymbiont of Urophora cardui]|uniref:hypothetical protein n=1 Tax=Rickettsia endosymbiont of Urophora cardui TaxID=3066265 RepID=UPI00313AAA93
MTCTNNQVGILMQKIKKYNQIISAAKAGMSVKTARKYLRINISIQANYAQYVNIGHVRIHL